MVRCFKIDSIDGEFRVNMFSNLQLNRLYVMYNVRTMYVQYILRKICTVLLFIESPNLRALDSNLKYLAAAHSSTYSSI